MKTLAQKLMKSWSQINKMDLAILLIAIYVYLYGTYCMSVLVYGLIKGLL